MNESKTDRHARRQAREEKVLAAMRREGLIRHGGFGTPSLTQKSRIALAIAASLLLVLSAGAIGYRLGRQSDSVVTSSASVRMQQSGDAYVSALRELLADAGTIDPAVLAQGREAALAVMLSGAAALSETLPDTAVSMAIHQLRVSRGAMQHTGS